jgi:hypothetical protein
VFSIGVRPLAISGSSLGYADFRVIGVISDYSIRCYEGDPVKGGFGRFVRKFRLHRKLLFGRVGLAHRPFNKVRFAKRMV